MTYSRYLNIRGNNDGENLTIILPNPKIRHFGHIKFDTINLNQINPRIALKELATSEIKLEARINNTDNLIKLTQLLVGTLFMGILLIMKQYHSRTTQNTVGKADNTIIYLDIFIAALPLLSAFVTTVFKGFRDNAIEVKKNVQWYMSKVAAKYGPECSPNVNTQAKLKKQKREQALSNIRTKISCVNEFQRGVRRGKQQQAEVDQQTMAGDAVVIDIDPSAKAANVVNNEPNLNNNNSDIAWQPAVDKDRRFAALGSILGRGKAQSVPKFFSNKSSLFKESEEKKQSRKGKEKDLSKKKDKLKTIHEHPEEHTVIKQELGNIQTEKDSNQNQEKLTEQEHPEQKLESKPSPKP